MVKFKNKIFIVLDSLRWDVFQDADIPFLKSLGVWKKAYSPGTYTLPAHSSFFIGKLPQTRDKKDFYDTAAVRFDGSKNIIRGRQLWSIDVRNRNIFQHYKGATIVDGFKNAGYTTFGTGGVSWFNPKVPASKRFLPRFDKYFFKDGNNFECHESAHLQVKWALSNLCKQRSSWFLFMNFGETHHRFLYPGCTWNRTINPYGNRGICWNRQKSCLEYLDSQIQKVLSKVKFQDLVICSDHGDCFGEDGLWGHGFFHEKVIEVPLLIVLNS